MEAGGVEVFVEGLSGEAYGFIEGDGGGVFGGDVEAKGGEIGAAGGGFG